MPLFAATIALSALLLFLVQPIVAKQILPWFGGSAGVWSVCLVFFQTALLAGYAYAHLITRRLRPVRQFQLHAALLVVSLSLLPIIPAASFKPRGGEDAALAILLLLLVTIGLPYFLLSSTGPLLQAWIARRFPGRSVYRLFALSNLGSLLGLVAFPFLVEPMLDSRRQAIAWSALYCVFVAACGFAANLSRRPASPAAEGVPAKPASATGESAAPGSAPVGQGASRWAGPGSAMVWLGLAGLGVVLLLATTNQLQQNVASIPFLWVLPLALYLLSFVVVFEARKGRGWYNPKWGVPLALIAAFLMAGGLSTNNGVLDVSIAVPLYCAGLFVACVFCHGELAARKPDAADLTRYYLMISVGGALGGIFVGLVAPRIFASLYELPLGLLFVAVAGFLAVLRRPGVSRAWAIGLCSLSAVAAVAIGWADWSYFHFLDRDLVLMERNFYGTLRVREIDDDGVRLRRLLHGVILHGEQPMSGPLQNKPGSYYTSTSGVGMAVLRAQGRKDSARLGVIGLGVGTLAAYGRANDSVRFYELDRDVVTIANASFTYLRSSPARIEVALGDARLSLENEWQAGKAQGFDVLAVDAFSSDSIPVHLITREAIELYMRHLAPDGILAVHISNRFLDLQPVLANIAMASGLRAVLIDDDVEDSRNGATSSEWVLLAADPNTLHGGPIGEHASQLRQQADVGVWTDGYNNLLRVVKNTPWEAIRRLVTSWREDS